MAMVVVVWLSVAASGSVGEMNDTNKAFEGWISREMSGRGHLPSLAAILAFADRELGFHRAQDSEAWLRRVTRRAWIPSIDARVGTDRNLDVRDATTTSWVRTGQGFGLQLRLRWSLADALFNDGVLRVEKTVRARRAARLRARDRLVNLYFERIELEIKLLTEPSPRLWLQAARIDSLLRAAAGQRLKYGPRAGNPWPRAQP